MEPVKDATEAQHRAPSTYTYVECKGHKHVMDQTRDERSQDEVHANTFLTS